MKFAIKMLVLLMLTSCSSLPTYYINKEYGHTPYPYGEGKHGGIDYGMSPGSPVIAASDGIVTRLRLGDEIGQNIITVLPGYGFGQSSPYEVTYVHLEEMFVREGDRVKRGQLLGLVSGKEKVPHLHYRIVKLGIGSSGIYYSNTYNPADFWLDGKPQCFDPKRDYSNADWKKMTLPVPCWELKKTLMKELNKK